LRARRAERAQERELARALGDGDRERVEDQESADQEGDAGEDQQRGGQEAERLGEVGRLLVCLLLPRAHVEALAELSGDRGLEPRGRRVAARGHDDLGQLAPESGDLLRLGQRHDHRRYAEGLAAVQGGDAADRVALGGRAAGDRDGVAGLEALVVRRRLVERDLVVGARRLALRVLQRVEALLLGRRGDERRPVGGDEVALLVEQVDVGIDGAGRRVDAVDAFDPLQHGRRHRALLRELLLHRELRGDGDVDALGRALEQVLERRVIVSVNTNVPATNATPSTTAKPVRTVRSLRASRPLSAILSTG
jgi:hypothetical protein